MKPMDAKQVEALLKKNGFRLVSRRGSHFKWANSMTGRTAIVPHHGSRTIHQGTLISIFKQAGFLPPQT